jgi:hypothetical protein
MFITPRCPLKRRREQNERGRFMKPNASRAADGRRIPIGTLADLTLNEAIAEAHSRYSSLYGWRCR